MGDFTIQVTSLHTPTTDADVLYEIDEAADIEVGLTINGERTAQLSISAADPLLATYDLDDFKQYLRVYYREQAQPVIWGPLRTEDDAEGRSGAGRIVISTVDALKLQRHFLRRGDDDALNDPDDSDLGSITADHRGIADVLQAAQNTAGQDARDMPQPGIEMGSTSTNRAVPMVVERGYNVWETIQKISGSATGPDFELAPVDDVSGVYAQLNCYDTQGSNIGRETDPVDGLLFTFGAPPEIGDDNLRNWRARRLTPTTHAHVLDDDREHRETSADEDSSGDIGAYVDWIQTSIKLDSGDTTLLQQIADAYVDAYGVPPVALDLELRPDALQTWHYGEGYGIGDVVSVYVVKNNRGFINTHMRITGVQLTRPGKRGPAQTVLTVVPQPPSSLTVEEA